MLTDFQNVCTAEKRITFARKLIRHYPPHLRHVATLPWKIKHANFLQIFSTHGRKCKHVAFLLPPQISIFSVFEIVSFPNKFVTTDVTVVFVNNQHGIQRREQDYDKTHKYTQNTQLHA